MTPYLSLIIPAYNEEQRIAGSLESAVNYFSTKNYDFEILVVDDGSKDNTVKLVKDFAVEQIRLVPQPRNMGKGAAVTRGMLEAKGEIRVFSDADFSTPVYEIDKVINTLSKHSKLKLPKIFFKKCKSKDLDSTSK
jgi:dolichyl-phosphate beta-glucosyltransferase